MSGLPVHHPIRVLRRNRRPIAAVLAALAVLLCVQAARPPGSATVAVIVAKRPIPAGATIKSGDLVVARVAPALVPARATTDPTQLVGAVTAVAIDESEPVSSARLLHAGLAADPENPLNLPMPIRIGDSSAARLLRPGNRINLIAAGGPGGEDPTDPAGVARTVAEDVLVLTLPGDTGDLELGGTTNQGALALISVDPDQALAVATAGASGRLTFTVAQ